MAVSADGTTVYVMAEPGGAVHAYDLAAGERRWSTPVDAPALASVAVADGVVLVMGATGDPVDAFAV